MCVQRIAKTSVISAHGCARSSDSPGPGDTHAQVELF
jgi:hypothetical protein